MTGKRSAGILLHITSLPSKFGIGDLGPEARTFADFLQHSRQKYWQLLPINPTEAGQGHSPYSSTSSSAGNTLLISPEFLVEDGLLSPDELHPHYLPQSDKTDFEAAEKVKSAVLEEAWINFLNGKNLDLQENFAAFIQQESYWLEDFALYMLLKQQNDGQPWFRWSDGAKHRNVEVLQELADKNQLALKKTKWLQFIFARQWSALRAYCHERNISFFGDLPFYISYDSADVWSNRSLFSLDEDGNMIGMAGVPPDAFSNEGQLWGMPVFRWEILKQTNYHWWTRRFKKNMELFDILRLDHFRAFADYWEVPAAEKTAKNGSWKPGPGAGLFHAVKNALGELPFIAEDLGEINEPVYQLRDEFNFPGMKILQFAFGHEMPLSQYIPHNFTENFIVYTGTHDNNTITGWYCHEARHYHGQLQQYFGHPLSENTIHYSMGRLAYSSVAKLVILPLQDVLGLSSDARMNTPASGNNNWGWRLLPGQLSHQNAALLREWTELYNRS